MDPVIKQKWLEALRSGKYEQGRGCLRSGGNKFCCLGVLHDVLGLPWLPPTNATCNNYSVEGPFGPETGMLPELARHEVGFGVGDATGLADLNDSGATFEQIALCIENGL